MARSLSLTSRSYRRRFRGRERPWPLVQYDAGNPGWVPFQRPRTRRSCETVRQPRWAYHPRQEKRDSTLEPLPNCLSKHDLQPAGSDERGFLEAAAFKRRGTRRPLGSGIRAENSTPPIENLTVPVRAAGKQVLLRQYTFTPTRFGHHLAHPEPRG